MKPDRTASISRKLTYGLTTIVVSSMVLVVGLIAVVAQREASNSLRQDNAEAASRLALQLSGAMWDTDLNRAHALAGAFLSDHVVRIVIREFTSRDSRVLESSATADTVSSRHAVTHVNPRTNRDEVIGEVVVSSDRRPYRTRVFRDVAVALIVAVIALVTLLGSIHWVLQRLLGRPLAALSDVVGRYASGDYSAPAKPIGSGELRAFSIVLGDMGRRIVAQLDELKNTNAQLGREVQARRDTERELQLQAAALAATADTVVITNVRGEIEWVNPAFTRVTGYELAEVLGKNPRFLASGQTPPDVYAGMWRTILDGQPWRGELVNRRKDASLFREEISITPILGAGGEITHFVAVKQDITERVRAAEELALMRQSIDSHPDAAYWFDRQNILVYCNESAAARLGYERQELIGRPLSMISPVATPARMNEVWEQLRRMGRFTGRAVHSRKDGSELPVEIYTTYVLFGGTEYAYGFATDITERMRAEAERTALQAQLTQAQKMESVGRLAGGVAHDFNNMLGVIMGNAELAVLRLDRSEDVAANLDEIIKAASKSSDLTRQLLAFARKQDIVPRVLDLNKTVTNSLRMLQRLIGAPIDLQWQPGADTWPVSMDPSQLDQILANLCVNARDAIEEVGTLRIATANCTLDAAFCATRADAQPGEYVKLTVADDGCGMDAEVLQHAFEPFFTTKAVGEGTGLGLATVYGAVRQNNGFIVVQSTPGVGTTFEIYLPRHVASRAHAEDVPPAAVVERGKETILVVEDEPALLQVAAAALAERGYRVLAAPGPMEALQLSGEYTGEIDLLLTDIIMPGMNGRNLAKTLTALRPRMRCLFMSGFAAQVTRTEDSSPEECQLIRKPFTFVALAAKVRGVLDTARES